jgi:hypothetical protein
MVQCKVYDISLVNPTANPLFIITPPPSMSDPAPKAAFPKAPNLSTNFDELLRKLDEEFARLPFKTLEQFYFCFDGLNFDVRRVERGGKQLFLVNATIGYMPFSIESDERREAIKTIISGSRSLPKVRFEVDTGSKISVGALFDASQVVPPDFIFYPLTLFMQEARPFIDLIGKYLFAPTPVRQSAIPAGKGS